MFIGVGRKLKRSLSWSKGTLGVVKQGSSSKEDPIKYRNPKLEEFDSYYDNRQYEGLPDWEQSTHSDGVTHLPVRERKPRLTHAFAKTLMSRVVAKMMGGDQFPSFKIQDSPEDQEFLRAVIREAKLKSRLLEPMRRTLNTGSVFVRFWIESGSYRFEWYHSKYCYPVFQSNGDLGSIKIRYVYTDKNDKDNMGNSKQKWYQIELTQTSEILYDNPDYEVGQEPVFQIVNQVHHNFGFVQGQWFRTCERKDSPDGFSLVEDIMSFIDELNYSLSQSSQAVGYNQDPQVWFRNMTEDELGSLIRSATKAWMLGREGEVGALETNMSGVEAAMSLRDKIRLNIQDITRIVLLDPEKIVGSAQSAKAMEVLHGPLKELIEEIRSMVEGDMKALVLKMSIATLLAAKMGVEVPITMPKGYAPLSLDVDLKWHPIFQQTIEDLQKKIAAAVSASQANIISRKTATRFIAEDFGIEDIEQEHAEIDAQPVLNPFAAF